MTYRIGFNETQTEDIFVSAKQSSALLDRIEALLREDEKILLGYAEHVVYKISADNTFCFYIEDNRIYAMTRGGVFQVKERLYQLEATFSDCFLKINQSCLVNMREIEKFETSLGGSLMVVLKNGYQDYISRRQLKQVKERFGI